jgi:hypothetical protein
MLGILLAACATTARQGEVESMPRPSYYPAFEFYSYGNRVPDGVTQGHHCGSFVCDIPMWDAKVLGPAALYEKYRDVPSNHEFKGVMYLIGCVEGLVTEVGWSGFGFETEHSQQADQLKLTVTVKHIEDMRSAASTAGCIYYRMRLDELPAGVTSISIKFNQRYWTHENKEESVGEYLRAERIPPPKLRDIQFDLSAAIANEANPSRELTGRRSVRQNILQGDVAWSWEVARNWRGIELLDGPLAYASSRPYEQSLPLSLGESFSWTYSRSLLNGPVRMQGPWSYKDDAGNWAYVLISEAGEQVGDFRVGKWLGTYTDGKPAYERVYEYGEIDSSVAWRPDGNETADRAFDGEVVTFADYYPNGTPRAETQKRRQKKHGYQRFWHENGQMKEERFYKNGQPTGVWKRWDEQGNLIQEEQDPKPGFPLPEKK